LQVGEVGQQSAQAQVDRLPLFGFLLRHAGHADGDAGEGVSDVGHGKSPSIRAAVGQRHWFRPQTKRKWGREVNILPNYYGVGVMVASHKVVPFCKS
jgi:hypothetical protein